MLRGRDTNKLYEECINSGICKEHLKELQVEDESQRHELQRKALLYVRLQMLHPVLFKHPFQTEKIKKIYEEKSYFNVGDNTLSREELLEHVYILDSVVVFTLTNLCNICCSGALFQTNYQASSNSLFLKLLYKKLIDREDILSFDPVLKANFSEFDEELVKICFVAVLLFVRNVSMFMNLRNILDQQDSAFESLTEEGARWNKIGSESFKQKRYEEAIATYTKALHFNPFHTPLLMNRAYSYIEINKCKDAAMDSYMALMIMPTNYYAYCKFATSLYIQSRFSECLTAAEYGLKKCKEPKTGEGDKRHQGLERIRIEAAIALENQQKTEAVKQESNALEKKDLPELIEASDSETECQDVPELMDPSNSDESDSDIDQPINSEKNKAEESAYKTSMYTMEQPINSEKNKAEESAYKTSMHTMEPPMNSVEKKEEQSEHKTSRVRSSTDVSDRKMDHEKNKTGESLSKPPRVRNSSVSEACDQKIMMHGMKGDSKERIEMVQSYLSIASLALFEKREVTSIRHYREVLEEIKAAPEIHKFEECDIICIKYAYAYACYQSGTYDDLQKALSLLQEIIEHNNINFPAAYFTIGKVYLKLNRFKQAHHYLKILDDNMLQESKQSNVYVWPGLAATIDETKLDYLKDGLPALMKECENYPLPDAICRYESCTLYPSIYYTDPDFKGFFAINCSEQCYLQYHPQCWKSIKTAKNCTDKLFLEQPCFTPDCQGLIIKIQNISKEKQVAKEFVHDDGKKSTKTKKSKLEKKLEIKEEKRRKRKDSSSRTDSTSEVPEEMVNEKLNEPENVGTTKEPEIPSKTGMRENNGNMNGSNVPQHPVNVEPLIVLKKDKLVEETSNKAPNKVKENKKVKANTISIDEFLQDTNAPLHSNDYQQRLNTLRQNNKSVTDGTRSKSRANSAQPSATSRSSSVQRKTKPKMEINGLDDFPDVELPKPLKASECLQNNIYSYFREILDKCGPMRVDDRDLIEKMKTFPEEARIIADCGGIGKFLQQNVEFAFVKNTYICLVEQLPLAYRKINEASLPLPDSDLKLTEKYESFEVADKNCSEIFRFSGLNPDAREYKPGTFLKHPSDDSTAEIEKSGPNSPEITSAILKLKHQLKVDQEKAEKKGVDKNMELSLPQMGAEGGILSRASSFSSTNSLSQSLIDAASHSGDSVTELIKSFKKLFAVYDSEEMKYHRRYIDVYLKPYTIGCVPKKYTRSVQTEETEKVSRGTMKTDDELQELRDMTCQLLQDRKVLEQEYNAALEYAAKFQNKSNMEIANLKKQSEEKLAALEAMQQQFHSKEGKLMKEVRVLTETLMKIKADIETHKKESEKVAAAKSSLLRDHAHLEEKVFSLKQEEKKLREVISEEDKQNNNIKKIKMEKEEAEKRAKTAELLLLQLKKSEFLKRIDIKKEEATKKIKEVEDGIAMISASLNPLYVKSISELVTQIRNYIALLEDIKSKFIVSVDEQINDVNNGTPLSKLNPLEVEELPDIPTWNVEQMANILHTHPAFGATLQDGNPVYNSGTFNPFSFASFNPFVFNGNAASSQQTNQDQKQTSVQNAHFSLCSNSLGQSGNISVPSVTKAPPGIPTTASTFHALASSMLNLNSSAKQSAVNIETKLKGASSSDIAAAGKSARSNDGTVEFAYAAAAALPNVKIPSEEKKAASSLELDYNIKPNLAVGSPSPRSDNSPPRAATTEVKKNGDKEAKKSFEKLLNKLQEKFPSHSVSELILNVKELRTRRKSGLSGLSLDKIIALVGEIIEDKAKNTTSQVKLPEPLNKTKMMPNAVLVNKKLVPETKTKEPPPPMQEASTKKCAWGVSDSEGSKQWTGSEIDEGCIICYEEMSPRTAYKVDCGHHFHFKCIKEWLDKKSDCPICRVHLLLPEDYPALSKKC